MSGRPHKPNDRDALFEEGVDLFNRGLYFECHEVLEKLWNQQTDPEKQFTQGLIQIAVATYHLKRGNTAGAMKLYSRGLARIKEFRPMYRGIDVHSLVAQVEAAMVTQDATFCPQIAVGD